MSEINALVRVSLARHRWILLVMVVSIIVGVLVASIAITRFPGLPGDRVAMLSLFFTLMPAGIAAIVLFDYGLDQDLNMPGSGCSHWILRMPIRDWKIAIVPVVLKTLWITTLWVLFVLAARSMGTNEIPLILPCVVFSSISIWIMVLSWRPFSSVFRRFALLVIGAPVLYCALLGAIGAPTIRQEEWRTMATAATAVAGIALYLGGVWCLIASTKLARTSPGGIIPVDGWHWKGKSTTNRAWEGNETRPVQHYRNATHALFDHDSRKSREWIRRLYLMIVVPTILVMILFVPVAAVSVVACFILFAYYSGFASARSFASPADSNYLPVYLAASPLSTKALAWGRQLFPLAAAFATYLLILVVIVGWACWPSNRATWMQWAEVQSAAIGGEPAPLAMGLRLSASIVLGIGVLLLGRMAAFSWVGMTGRTWMFLFVTIVTSIAVLTPLGLILRWFMRQTDWESTRAAALQALVMLPWLVGGLLLVKAVLTFIVGYVSVRRYLITTADVIRVIALWTIVTLTLGVIFHLLVPYPVATLAWCLALTALAVPLARVLALPLALSMDRHR